MITVRHSGPLGAPLRVTVGGGNFVFHLTTGQGDESALRLFEYAARRLRETLNMPQKVELPRVVAEKALTEAEFLAWGERERLFQPEPAYVVLREDLMSEAEPAKLAAGGCTGPSVEQQRAQWQFIVGSLKLAQANLREGFERRMLDAALVMAEANARGAA